MDAESPPSEAAAAAEDDLLRAFFESTLAGFAVLRPDMSFLRVNDTFCRIVGRTREELAGLTCADLSEPADAARTAEELNRALARGATEFVIEKRYVRPDGSRVWVQNSVSIQRDPTAKLLRLVVVCQDVTERRRVQTALRERTAALRGIADGTQDLIYIKDRSSRLLFANPATLAVIGCATEEEALGTNEADRGLPPEEVAAMVAVDQRVVDSGCPEVLEEVYSGPRGRRVYLSTKSPLRDETGAVVGVIGVSRDITERLAVEAALRQSEERYRAFIENSSEGVWRLEFDPPLDTTASVEEQVEQAYRAGRFAECNAAMARMYGLPRAEDLIGRSLDFMLPADDPDARAWLSTVIVAGYRVSDAESVERDAAGREVHFSNSMVGVVEQGRLLRMWGTQREITARKLAEAALRESEARYRFIVENTSDGIWRVELSEPMPTDLPEDEQVAWYERTAFIREGNLELARMYGFASAEALVGLPLREVMPLNRRQNERLLRDFIRAGYRLVDAESREVGPDGAELVFLNNVIGIVEDGRLRGEWGTNRDITERTRAEEALRRSEERLRATVAVITDVPWVVNSRGAFVEPQAAWEAYTGQSWEQHRGFGWIEAVHPDDRERVRVRWEQAVEDGGNYESQGRLWHAPSGQWRHFVAQASPLREPGSAIREWVGSCTDIETQKRSEAQLRAARDEAERASRAKDRFLAVLSHELRTPLTPVLLAAGSLERDDRLPASAREDLAMMRRNIELETKLIDDLLDLSRVTTGKLDLQLEPTDLREVVRRAAAMCRAAAPAGVTLELSLDEAAAYVQADAARLQQVLGNVLTNAFKFTPAPGIVRVITTVPKPGRCEVRVTDTGMGIPASLLPRIFDPFEQGAAGARRHGGLGLGLAISRALVERQGGSIRAESEGEGRGATFFVELPAAERPPTAAVGNPNVASAGTSLRLLVVEDHPDTALMLRRMLELQGFHVMLAADVMQAKGFVESEPFDLLLSDLGLPDGDGYEVMRHVRRVRGVPGVAMSGYGMEEDVRRSRQAGFAAHLVKPVDGAELLAAIRGLVADARR